MTQLATTQEQSSRLLECGVSAESADMFYKPLVIIAEQDYTKLILFARNELTVGDIPSYPAWSLSALLGLLPTSITDKNGTYFQLQLTAYPHEEDCYKWCLSYYSIEGEISLLYIEAPDPIEACVYMIDELTANGYKLNDPDCPCQKKGGKE